MLERANWDLIPDYMREGIREYIEHGRLTGDFLGAILENDLKSAVQAADGVNRGKIADYVIFFFNYAPAPCWGSKERVCDWRARGGLLGKSAAVVAERPAMGNGPGFGGRDAEHPDYS